MLITLDVSKHRHKCVNSWVGKTKNKQIVLTNRKQEKEWIRLNSTIIN